MYKQISSLFTKHFEWTHLSGRHVLSRWQGIMGFLVFSPPRYALLVLNTMWLSSIRRTCPRYDVPVLNTLCLFSICCACLEYVELAFRCAQAKIVRALWLAKRSVYMRVCTHGCDVKMFCFSRANHASTNLKKFLSSKLDKFTHLPIPSSAETWNIFTNKLCQFCFRLSWHFKREKSVFWNRLLAVPQDDHASETDFDAFSQELSVSWMILAGN